MARRTTTLYVHRGSTGATEAWWDEQKMWERRSVEARGGTVTEQRVIQWGSEPRIETDYYRDEETQG